MSWHYSRAPGAEYSAVSYATMLLSERLSTPSTLERYCCNGNATEYSTSSQYGTTCERSDATTPKQKNISTDCEQLPTASLSRAGSLAKTLVAREKARVSTTGQGPGFGLKCAELLAKYDPDTHSLKTPQLSLFAEEQELLPTLPKWGMIANGELSELTPPGLTINAPAFGWLPTIRKSQYKASKFIERSVYKCNFEEIPSLDPKRFGHLVGKRINPRFLEHYMGFPIGWVNLAPLETPKFLLWLKWHGIF